MTFNGLGGDGKFLADLFMGEVAQTAELKYLSALRGQLFYSGEDVLQLFFVEEPFFFPWG